MQIEDTWFGLEGDNEGRPFLVRGRENLNEFRESGKYQTRIDILWTYSSTDDSQMPGEKDLALMETVENSLVEHLELNIESILAFVFTGSNQRVWYWYCQSKEETMRRINNALAIFDRLPIEFYSQSDPDWEEYNALLD